MVILDNIRSVYNTASIFRTADGFGVSKTYLVGTTPSPVDRFGRVRDDFTKVSLGAEYTVPYESVETIEEAIEKVRNEGYVIVALEASEKSLLLKDVPKEKKMAFILGSETEGVSEKALEMADYIAGIPMRGSKESFNVAVAAGIALYEFSR